MGIDLGYDPERAPDPAEWLATSEWDRMALVHAWHVAAKVPLAERAMQGHATIHVIVENQLAADEPPAAAEALVRLRAEGLSRHDAVHAIGSVLAEHLHSIIRSGGQAGNPNAAYVASLRKLTRKSLRDLGK